MELPFQLAKSPKVEKLQSCLTQQPHQVILFHFHLSVQPFIVYWQTSFMESQWVQQLKASHPHKSKLKIKKESLDPLCIAF